MIHEVETVESCILCGSPKAGRDPWFERQLALSAHYGVRRCAACDLRWLSPRPTAQGYETLYRFENYFTKAGGPEDYASVVEERKFHFETRIKKLEKIVGTGERLKILDIGAATGEFLALAKARRHHPYGIELSEGARLIAQEQHKLNLSAEPLEKYSTGAPFDVVHLNHVLEHLPDPRASVARCVSLLKPGGILVIEVPQQLTNDLDRLRRILFFWRRPKFSIYSLHHTYFFSPVSLRALLEREGLEILNLSTAASGRTPLNSIKNLVLRLFLGVADALHGGGNVIEVYARKLTNP